MLPWMWKLGTFVPPMLATPAPALPAGEAWTFEIKWDGVRAQLHVDSAERVRLFTRRGREVSKLFPELQALGAIAGAGAVVDGELVVQREDGCCDFAAVMGRLMSRRRAHENPVTFIAFDVLIDAGMPLAHEPYATRRDRLARRPRVAPPWYAPDSLASGGQALLEGRLAAEERIRDEFRDRKLVDQLRAELKHLDRAQSNATSELRGRRGAFPPNAAR
jgi:bifunctional non-homologous end joining protein LigD